MKGRIIFVYELKPNDSHGKVYFWLPGQKCKQCPDDSDFVHAMWYSDEVEKVRYSFIMLSCMLTLSKYFVVHYALLYAGPIKRSTEGGVHLLRPADSSAATRPSHGQAEAGAPSERVRGV